MLKDTAGILRNTIIFINQFFNNKIIIDEDKITRVVNECNFSKLQNLEKEIGFDETFIKDNIFFRKGKEKSWENILPEILVKQIENNFSEEMKKLNYI